MAFETIGQEILRKEFLDTQIREFARRLYKMKQVLTISRTGAWKNDFFREDQEER
jgi:hypothetical protein